MSILGNVLLRSSYRFKKLVIEYSGAGHVRGAGHGCNVDNENV